MKSKVLLLSALLFGTTLTACPDPNATNPNPSTSPTSSSSASVSPSDIPSSEPSSSVMPSDMPSSAPSSSPTPTSAVPYPSSTPYPITTSSIDDGYRLTIDGTTFPTSTNSILNERYEASNGKPGYLRLGSFGYETVGDSSSTYSFQLTLTGSSPYTLSNKFTQADFAKVYLEVKKVDKKTGKMYNFAGETVPGLNKAIPATGMGNSIDNAGNTSSSVFSSTNEEKKYSGYVDTVLSAQPNQSGIREVGPIRVKVEFNVALKDKIYQ